MTPEQLLEAGYQEFNWNNGAIMEYWKPLRGYSVTATEQFERRLAVRFGEWKHQAFRVFLLTEVCGIQCQNVQTVEQLEALYRLVAGAEGVGDGR